MCSNTYFSLFCVLCFILSFSHSSQWLKFMSGWSVCLFGWLVGCCFYYYHTATGYCSRWCCCYYCCFSQLFLLLLLSRSLLHKNLTKDLNPKVNKLWWKRMHKIFGSLKFFVQFDGGWTFLFAHMEIFAVNYRAAAPAAAEERDRERESDAENGWQRNGIDCVFHCFSFASWRLYKTYKYIGSITQWTNWILYEPFSLVDENESKRSAMIVLANAYRKSSHKNSLWFKPFDLYNF